VKKGEFREDLYYRLKAKHIKLPPLRNRKGEIHKLATYFLNKLKPKLNKSFSSEALDFLEQQSWPGNIRELKRFTEQVAFSCRLPLIRVEDIQAWLSPGSSTQSNLPATIDLNLGLVEL